MENLFLVHTPYHVVLASGIASTLLKDDINILVIFRDFDTNSIDINALSSVFKQIIILEGNLDIKNNSIAKFMRVIQNKKNIYKIKIITNKYKFKSLYIFNDAIITDKKTMSLTNKNNKCKIIYVEDGAEMYSSAYILNNYLDLIKWRIKKWLYKLGEYGNEVKMLGTSNNINIHMALFPQLVRKEFKDKTIEEISEEQLREGIYKVYKNYIDTVNFFDDSVIIFLDIFEYIKPIKDKYIKIIEKITQLCSDLGKKSLC